MATLAEITGAQKRMAPYVHRTPLWPSRTLSRMLGYEVYLKAELFQKTGSFKPRGMLTRLESLTEAQRRAGVVSFTFSAVNSARGLGYAAAIFGVKATVVLPAHASPSKVEATRRHGAEVVLHGETPAECLAMCRRLERERHLTFVSAYDPEALTGFASIGLEIFEDLPDVHAVFVGVGGGGLLGGIALGLRAQGSAARLIGVEPEGAPKMHRSLGEGRPAKLDAVNTIAEGLGTSYVGEYPWAVAQQHVEGVVLVSDGQILQALRLLLERCKVMAEPAAAAAVAGLMFGRPGLSSGGKVVCVLSGGNIELAQLKDLL